MFYDFAMTVPAGRTEAAPLITDLQLTKGTIHRVEVAFRAGCDHRVFCRILRGLNQLYPTDQDGAFCADDYVIGFDDSFDLDDEPMKLQAVCYAPTSTYPHVITVRIGVLDKAKAASAGGAGAGLGNLLRFLGIGG